MAIPRRTSLGWKVLSLASSGSVFAQPPQKVRKAAEQRKKMIANPISIPVVGRLDKRVDAHDTTAHLADGSHLPVRVYRPRDAVGDLPLIMNFHGGGFVAGDPRQSEWWSSTIAADVNAVVVSVDYRKAPEHPYPAAPEDCYATTEWAVAHAGDLRADAHRLAVMGDSAGGNLAAVVALMARDRGGPRIAYQVLIYPVVEMVDEFASEVEKSVAPVLTKLDMDGAEALYFHGIDAARKVELYASPLRADLHGLPPALIQTAEHDPLRDQGSAYAEKLRAAGVPARLTNYVEGVHGYISIKGLAPCARQAEGEAAAQLREALT